MRATRPPRRLGGPAALGALFVLAACGTAPEPAATPDSADQALASQAAAAPLGTLWPNLMLLDGDQPMELSEAAGPLQARPARFRIHVDVKLSDRKIFDSLGMLLRQSPLDSMAIRTLLKDAATLSGADTTVRVLIDSIPYKKKPTGHAGPWPRHELFMDRGTEVGPSPTYWYRMELDLKIPDTEVDTVATLLHGNSKADLIAAVDGAVGVPALLKPLLNAIAIR